MIGPRRGLKGHYADTSPIYSMIMSYITCSAQGRCSVRDVVKATGISRNPCRRVLEYLRLKGLVQRQSDGRTFIYSALHDSPAVAHFKIFETIRSLQPLVKRLRNQTHRIVLYSPAADGTDSPASDITSSSSPPIPSGSSESPIPPRIRPAL